LKPMRVGVSPRELPSCSIHPQGWVPIETLVRRVINIIAVRPCSIHPQGWVPIETSQLRGRYGAVHDRVAFTPKGGCPLKLVYRQTTRTQRASSL